MPPCATRDGKGRRRCTVCQTFKMEQEEFCWQDRTHRYRDAICRACRARRQGERRKPKNAHRPYAFKPGLSAHMHDHLNDVTLAYIAGLVDGEASIHSSQPKSNCRPLCIRVTMIHRPTIEFLQETCGGWVGCHRNKQLNARQAYTWTIAGVRTYSLLLRIAPFMRTKREEAEVAITLGATLWSENVRGRVTDETHSERAILGQQLRDLKRVEWIA